MKKIVALALVVGAVACTSAEWTQITNATGQVCETVFQAIDPTLGPPLCTTAVDIENAIQALTAASPVDSGIAGAPFGAMSSADRNAAIYKYLAAHGALPVKK